MGHRNIQDSTRKYPGPGGFSWFFAAWDEITRATKRQEKPSGTRVTRKPHKSASRTYFNIMLRVVKGIFVLAVKCEMAIFSLVNRDFHSSREAWSCKIIFLEINV